MPSPPWASSRVLPIVEVLAVAAIFWADANGWVPVSKTPFLLLLAWASLRLRGLRWREVGLHWPDNGWQLLAVGVAAGVVFWLFEYFVENPLFARVTGLLPDLSDFRPIVGNLTLLGVTLVLNLVLAAFGEEMVWRGYLLPRIAALWNNSKPAWAIAILLSNFAFGAAHWYQGESGAAQAAVQGALLACLYLATGKILLAPMAAHFTANTCDLLLIYSGSHVGLGLGQ